MICPICGSNDIERKNMVDCVCFNCDSVFEDVLETDPARDETTIIMVDGRDEVVPVRLI